MLLKYSDFKICGGGIEFSIYPQYLEDWLTPNLAAAALNTVPGESKSGEKIKKDLTSLGIDPAEVVISYKGGRRFLAEADAEILTFIKLQLG